MPQGTIQLSCKVCGSKINIPWGRKLSPLETQCPYGCYEIYPDVLSWNAKQKKLRILRAEALALLKRYQSYDRLVRACSQIVAVREDKHQTTITVANPSVAKRSPVKV